MLGFESEGGNTFNLSLLSFKAWVLAALFLGGFDPHGWCLTPPSDSESSTF